MEADPEYQLIVDSNNILVEVDNEISKFLNCTCKCTCIHVFKIEMRRKKERNKQGQTNKQGNTSTPKPR